MSFSRRQFLERSVLAGAGLVVADHSAASWAEQLAAGMIVRSQRFIDLETPPGLFHGWITPVDDFFIRNHMSEPVTFDAEEYALKITGQVEKPISLSLGQLRKLATASVTNTLECAGNGRAFYEPHLPGVQWRLGAVGNARFTGPRMKDVLQQAGVKPSGKFVAFKGLDEPPSKVPKFVRSIPIEKALDPDTLLATQMNGAPLTKHHGYPVRALVPGWIGAASCKWLAEIEVLEHEFDGNFMKPGYRMPNHPLAPGGAMDLADTHPVTALRVKSLITSPTDGATHRRGPVSISGAAWAGEDDVTKVEVSTDGGASWQPAQLGHEHAKYAWRLFHHAWTPKSAGDHVIMARATDSQGRTQPEKSGWNPGGYLWNGIQKVRIHVQA